MRLSACIFLISKSTSVIPVSLDLVEIEIIVEPILRTGDDKQSFIGTAPYLAIHVLCHAIKLIWHDGSSILVGNGTAQKMPIVLYYIQCSVGVKPEETLFASMVTYHIVNAM